MPQGLFGTWSGFEVDVDIQDWFKTREIDHAIHQRELALCNRYHPRPNHEWDSGTIAEMTATSLTDAARTPILDDEDNPNILRWADNRWNNFIEPGVPEGDRRVPKYYDVIIYSNAFDAPWKICRAFIQGNTFDTLTFSDIGLDSTDFATFIGKRYSIIKQFGYWWQEKIRQWPNPPTAYLGTESRWLYDGAVTAFDDASDTLTLRVGSLPVAGPAELVWEIIDDNFAPLFSRTSAINEPTFTIIEAAASAADVGRIVRYRWRAVNVIQEDGRNWIINQWQGKRAAFHTRGRTRSGVIASNTRNTLTITVTNNHEPQDETGFAIYTPKNNIDYILGHEPDHRRRWTGSPIDFRFSHTLDDHIAGSPGIALQQVDWLIYPEPGTGGPAVTESRIIFDVDLWSGITEKVEQSPADEFGKSGPDANFTRDYYKSDRAQQVWAEERAGAFVENRNYSGTQSVIPAFTIATRNLLIGLNSGVGSVVGWRYEYISGDLYHYVRIRLGASIPYSPIGVHYAVLNKGGRREDDRVLTSGWIVVSSNEFEVIASGTTEDDIGAAVAFSYGFTRKLPLEFRWMFDRIGFDPGFDEFGNVVIDPTSDAPGLWRKRNKSTTARRVRSEIDGSQVGKVIESADAFVTGKNYRYVGMSRRDPTLDAPWDRDAPGFDALIEHEDKGFFDGAHPFQPAPPLTGIATSGTGYSLTDSGKAWLAFGIMRTDSGTAASGSDTTLDDPSKAGDGRWDAATGRWIGFILKLTKGAATAKVPITGFAGTVLTFPNWSGIVVDATTTYEIVEPKHYRDRWAGRTLRIVKPASGEHLVTITHSDSDTLYFEPGTVTVEPGDEYQILDPKHGTIWQWDGAKFIPPPGWTEADQIWGVPDRITRYGRALKGDDKCDLTEIADAINALRCTATDATYRAALDLAEPEVNYKFAGSIDVHPDMEERPEHRNAVDQTWNGSAVVPPATHRIVGASTGIPRAIAKSDSTTYYKEAQTGWAYFQTCVLISRSADLYIMPSIDINDAETVDPIPTDDSYHHFSYDDNGAGLPGWRVWNKVHTFGTSFDAELIVQVGNPAMPLPTWGPDYNLSPGPDIDPVDGFPDYHTGVMESTRGWYPLKTRAVIKWDFTYI